MAQSIKCLPYTHEDLVGYPTTHVLKLSVVVSTDNLSSGRWRQAESWRSLASQATLPVKVHVNERF